MTTPVDLSSGPQPPPRIARQDVAPKGGYPPINIARNVPKSIGRNGATGLLIGTALMMSYGFYKVGTFNVKRRELRQEKKDIRHAIIPMLQAEEDARFVKERESHRKWEAEVMKDTENWKVGENVYKTRTFMPPVGDTPPYTHD